MLVLLKYAVKSLQEACKGDCYLVFHKHDSGPSWGQRIDSLLLFFVFYFFSFDIRCQCLWNGFLLLAQLTLSLNFGDLEAVVIFSISIHLISCSLMEASDLLLVLLTVQHTSSNIGFTKITTVSIGNDRLDSGIGHNWFHFKLNWLSSFCLNIIIHFLIIHT